MKLALIDVTGCILSSRDDLQVKEFINLCKQQIKNRMFGKEIRSYWVVKVLAEFNTKIEVEIEQYEEEEL